MESRDESTESEKQFFSWRIKKGDSVMNRKDAIRENEPYIPVEGPGWGKVEFFGKCGASGEKPEKQTTRNQNERRH